MATLQELRTLFGDSDLMERVESAIVIAAYNLLASAPTADQQKWAAAVFASPLTEARKALMGVLAANADADLAVIIAVGDNPLQINVNAMVDSLVVAYNV